MTFAFNLSLAGYGAALLLATAKLLSRQQRRFASATTVVLAAGAIVRTVYMAWRWLAAGRSPFSNMFESLVLFAWDTYWSSDPKETSSRITWFYRCSLSSLPVPARLARAAWISVIGFGPGVFT